MLIREIPLVWKVNGVILVILGSVFGMLTYATILAYKRDALASAREVSRVNAQTILHGLRELMMDRDTAGMGDLFGRLVSDTETHRDISLVSHGGRVVVSSSEPAHSTLEPGSWQCSVCHGSTVLPGDSTLGPFAEISEGEDGERVLSVVTPIYREGSCDASGCHTEPATSPILGMLQADFSLSRVDGLIAQRFRQTALALVISLLLCSIATWWMMDRLVGRRIRALKDGAERVAGKDLSFRFGDPRGDGIAQMSGTFDDTVSQLSATLLELTRTKEYLQGIVESSADIIITVDPSGLIKTFNTGAERVLGYDREEVTGKRIEVLFANPGERDAAIEQLHDSDHVVNYETHFLTKSGEVRDVILTLSRLRTPDGEAIGTFGISKDVTREKRLQRELLLKEKLAAIGQAVTGIQHTLKNMLSSLKGGSYLVETGLRDHEQPLLEEGWAMVKDGVGNIHHLCSTMLHYVREWEPEVDQVDLYELMTSVRTIFGEIALKKGIDLRIEIASGLPKTVCDGGSIHSVLTDLLSNAFDACVWKDYAEGEKPEVVVKVTQSKRDDSVAMEVQDNGQGMAHEIKRHIFAPFFSTKKKLGTGIGLTLAQRIIRMHDGTIEFESEPNCGSTFRVLLPVCGPLQKKGALDEQEGPHHRRR